MNLQTAPAAAMPAAHAGVERAALFFDVDGTLVWHGSGFSGDFAEIRPSEAVYRAFERLRERGHQAFICTGRPVCWVSGGLAELPVAGLVTSAGAAVVLDGRIVYERAIERELLEQTVNRLVEARAVVMLEGSRECVVLAPAGEEYPGFANLPHASSLAELCAVAPDLRFCKMCYEDGMVERMARVMDFILAHYTVCDLGLGAHEISVRGVDKGAGVAHALELLGEPRPRTYGFGDSENDLAMLRAVDVPVAMGNALDSVKAAAAYVTDSVEHDGVPKALEHFGLI